MSRSRVCCRFRLVAGWELVISAPKYNRCGQAHRRGRSARIVIFQGQAYTSVSDTVLYRIATVEPKAARTCLLPSTPLADRKSTRLYSSHVSISYAVSFLKIKKISE